MKCSKEKLIRAWYSSESKEEASRKTGLSISTINRYSWKLRKAGVRLDSFASERRKEDIDSLKELSEVLAEKRIATLDSEKKVNKSC